MGINAKLGADFSSFTEALDAVDKKLKGTGDVSKGLGGDFSSLARLFREAGGAAGVAASDQAKLNAVIADARTKYQNLGLTVPPSLRGIETATKGVAAETDRCASSLAKADEYVKIFSGDATKGMMGLGAGVKETASAMTEAVGRMGGAQKLTEANQRTVNKTVTEAIATYHALGQAAPADMQKLADATKQVAKDGGSALGTLISIGRTVGSALGIGFGLNEIVSFTRELVSSASAIDKLAKQTGMGVVEIQRLQYAADQSDVSIESMTSSVNQLQQRLAGDNVGAVAAVKKLGLSLFELENAKPDEAIYMISRAFESIPSPAERTLIAVQLFGRGGAEALAPLLENMRAVAAEAPTMSKETIASLDAMERRYKAFKAAITVSIAELFFGENKDAPSRFGKSGAALDILEQRKKEAAALQTEIGDMLAKTRADMPFAGNAPISPLTGYGMASISYMQAEGKDALHAYQAEMETYRKEIDRITITGGLPTLQKLARESEADLGKLADQFGVSASTVTRYAAALQSGDTASKKLIEANVALAGANKILNDNEQTAIDNLARRGLDEAKIAVLTGINEVAVRKYTTSVKDRLEAEKNLNAWMAEHVKAVNAQSESGGKAFMDREAAKMKASTDQMANLILAGDTYQDKLTEQSLHGTDLRIFQLEREYNAEIAKLGTRTKANATFYDNLKAKIDAFYGHQADVVEGTYDTMEERLRANGVLTIADLTSTANRAQAAYEYMAAHADKYTKAQIAAAKATADAARQAAGLAVNWKEIGVAAVFALDSIADSAGLADNAFKEMVGNTAKAAARGGPLDAAFTFVVTFFDQMFSSMNDNSDAVKELTHDFDDLLNAELAWQYDRALDAITQDLADQGLILSDQVDLYAALEQKQLALQRLTASMVPMWDRIGAIAERYGIDLERAGRAAQQLMVRASAGQLINDWEQWAAIPGAVAEDMDALLAGMAPQMQTLVQQAQQFGSVLPENMRPLIEAAAAAGKLLDKTGKPIDITTLVYGPAFETEQEKNTAALALLTRQITYLSDQLNRAYGLPADNGLGIAFGVPSTATTVPNLNLPPIDLSSLNIKLPPWVTDPNWFTQNGGFLPGAPNGTPPPDYGGPQASGGDYWVTKPTLFLAGDRGPDRATFTPRGGSGNGAQVNITISAWDGQSVDTWLRTGGARRITDTLKLVTGAR